MNTRFWTKKDVVRSKEFMFAIQKRLKTRHIFQNLESFVGGRIREGDYRVGSSICAKPFRISMHILRGSEWYMMAIVEIPKTDPVINLSGVIRMVRLEHLSDTKVLAMKMEILLEPTSNKLLEILLKMNLPDHRSSKDRDGDTSFQWSQFTTQCSHLMFPRPLPQSQTVSLNPIKLSPKNKPRHEAMGRTHSRECVRNRRTLDRLPTCLAHMLYCVVAEEQYNLAYFFVKESNVIEYCNRKSFRKARHSVSSSSSHHQGMSSHQHDDDDDDVKTSRASTPSPTTYLNSLDPLNYQNYQMPSASE
ncbi:hypothetical protein Tco_1403576 [Tanacetum coccineum]